MKSRMRSKILDNFGLKLLSVLFAFILWLTVMNISDRQITVEIDDIPVQQLNGAALEELDQVYDVAKGDTVDIIVKGRRSVVEDLDASDFIASADLSTMSITNTVQISVVPKSVGIRNEISISCVDNVMRLNLEEKVSLQYSVKVKTFGSTKDGYAVCSQQTSPNIVTIEGPKSAVEKVTEVVVRVDVSHLDKSTDTEGVILLYDAYGDQITNGKISTSQSTVKVHIDIYPTKEVPVIVNVKGVPKDGYKVSEVIYQPQTTLIAGEPEALDKINELVINDMYISGMDEDLETAVELKSYLPDNVYLADSSEEVVITVSLEELVRKDLKVKTSDITLLQKSADKTYELELSDDFTIVVTGLDSAVTDIDIAKLAPKIYCKDLSIGNHSNVDIDLTQIEGLEYEIIGTAALSITSE